MIIGLPKSLEVNGRDEPIRWEYTAVLDAISAMNDPELEDNEKVFASLYIIYENFSRFTDEDFAPAFEAMVEFINNDVEETGKPGPKLIDYEQDAKIMFPAINRVAGREIRNYDNIHWWTFLGWLMEIGECTYSMVLTIRNKKANGKKLENYESEFYNKNKRLVDIQPKLTEEEKEMERWLNEMLS